MKRLIYIFLLKVIAIPCMAQWGPRRIPKEPAENYEVKVGNVTMLIDAANGARIMSFTYEGQEVLSQNPMPNMYGSTFWTSPQKEWNWPPVHEHDMGRYSVQQVGNSFLMTSKLSNKIPLRIQKQFTPNEKNKCIDVTYTIINEGGEDRSVAPWEVTRVPGEGCIKFQADVETIWPVGLMYFKQNGKQVCFEIDKVDKQRKINANGCPDATDGKSWLRYENNGLEFTKRFPDLNPGEPAPGEDEIQVYVHQNALYCEIEEQGPYKLLHPGEKLEWTVSWYLKKY